MERGRWELCLETMPNHYALARKSCLRIWFTRSQDYTASIAGLQPMTDETYHTNMFHVKNLLLKFPHIVYKFSDLCGVVPGGTDMEKIIWNHVLFFSAVFVCLFSQIIQRCFDHDNLQHVRW